MASIPRLMSTTLAARLCGALLCLLLARSTTAAGPRPGDTRILALVESTADDNPHSSVLQALRDKNFIVDQRLASSKAELFIDGEWYYHGLIVLTPSSPSIGGLTPTSIVDFIDRGNGSVFIAASPDRSAACAELAAAACAVNLAPAGHYVLDHGSFHAHADFDPDHKRTAVAPGGIAREKRVVGNAAAAVGDVVFRGTAASLDEDNELVEKVLWGSRTAYTAELDGEVTGTPLVGAEVVIASVLQTRMGARATFVGSVEMLRDEVIAKAGEAHAGFVHQLMAWTFGQSGYLRAANVRHSRISDGAVLGTYRIKDKLDFAIDVQEWSGDAGAWVPYDADDVQLEFTMMDPYQRSRLHSLRNGTFTCQVQVPDRIGMFKFAIEYIRTGFSHVQVAEPVSIRPFDHNEFERFIVQAFPYYASVFSMIVGVLLFGVVLLYGQQKTTELSKNKAE